MKTPNKHRPAGEGPVHGLLVFTNDGTIRFADQNAGEILCLPKHGLTGRPLNQVIHAGEWIFDLFRQLGKGEEDSFSSRLLGLEDNSSIIGTVGRIESINTIDLGIVLFRIQAWEPSHPKEKSASERFSKLMASFAHELRNPLAAIRGLVDLLADGLHEEESPEVINRIRLQITRMEKLTRELVHVQFPQ